MKTALRLGWLAVVLAACSFAYALAAYLRTGSPPADPRPRPVSGRLPSAAPRVLPPSTRYAPLAEGRPFFAPPAREAEEVGQEAEPATYVSGLALRGIVLAEGRAPMAVLTRSGAPATGESWTVRVGETVLGETVVAIGRESVTLRKEGKETVLVLAR